MISDLIAGASGVVCVALLVGLLRWSWRTARHMPQRIPEGALSAKRTHSPQSKEAPAMKLTATIPASKGTGEATITLDTATGVDRLGRVLDSEDAVMGGSVGVTVSLDALERAIGELRAAQKVLGVTAESEVA